MLGCTRSLRLDGVVWHGHRDNVGPVGLLQLEVQVDARACAASGPREAVSLAAWGGHGGVD
eukprot:CAMPEP_0202828230 /NCGR_PEP_ID=MMETSP1389-20130828/14819_1 /ASSEMBLY_ACC=CAM_ASM_000865 /TAXON_ID=302021 /ORGANISM="Rhodomonas sp., Strain CCMP768" /LENGTH=60 /DNA_ID=CAMNT_0049501715 /DNA_START=98 /DNA_END=277 /DNA_ORIENTATION=+